MDFIAPQGWTQDAKCRSLGGSRRADLMFPSPRDNKEILRAKRFCQGCPVAVACLAEGLEDPHAVRAGLTGDERRHLKEGAVVAVCVSCELPFVPRPANRTRCTGCLGRFDREATPDDFKDDILAMARQGSSGEQICQHFGFSRDEIRLAARRWKVKLMRPGQADCGTTAGAARHRRLRETVCHRCLAAETRRAAERRGPLVAA